MSLPRTLRKARIKYKPQPQYPDEARREEIKSDRNLKGHISNLSGEVYQHKISEIDSDQLARGPGQVVCGQEHLRPHAR